MYIPIGIVDYKIKSIVKPNPPPAVLEKIENRLFFNCSALPSSAKQLTSSIFLILPINATFSKHTSPLLDKTLPHLIDRLLNVSSLTLPFSCGLKLQVATAGFRKDPIQVL